MVRHPALRPLGLKARGEKCKEGSAAPQVREGFRTPPLAFRRKSGFLSFREARACPGEVDAGSPKKDMRQC